MNMIDRRKGGRGLTSCRVATKRISPLGTTFLSDKRNMLSWGDNFTFKYGSCQRKNQASKQEHVYSYDHPDVQIHQLYIHSYIHTYILDILGF